MNSFVVLVIGFVFETTLFHGGLGGKGCGSGGLGGFGGFGGFGGSGGLGGLNGFEFGDFSWSSPPTRSSSRISASDLMSLFDMNLDLSDLTEDPFLESEIFHPETKQIGDYSVTGSGENKKYSWGNEKKGGSIMSSSRTFMIGDPSGKAAGGNSLSPTQSGIPYQSSGGIAKPSSFPNNNKSGSSTLFGSPSYNEDDWLKRYEEGGMNQPPGSPLKPSSTNALTSTARPSGNQSATSANSGLEEEQENYDDMPPIFQTINAELPDGSGQISVKINTSGITTDEFKPFSDEVKAALDEYFNVESTATEVSYFEGDGEM